MGNYRVAARSMDGNSVNGYVLENGEDKMRVDYGQMCFLVGRGLVENCDGQIYREKVIISGINGFKLSELPIMKEKAGVKGTYKVSSEDITKRKQPEYSIVGVVKNGPKVSGYDTDNRGYINKAVVEQDALEGKVGNVTTQMYKGKVLLRGTNMKFKDLPVRLG